MDATKLVGLAIQLSLALIVISIALGAKEGDAVWLLRQPGLLLRSLVSMFIVMPLLALAMAKWGGLDSEVKLALLALALAPVPPILPKSQVKAGGDRSYAIALLVVSALIAIGYIPAAVAWLTRDDPHAIFVPPMKIAKIVGMSVLLPLALGIALRKLAPGFSHRIRKPLALVGNLLLLAGVLPLLIKVWPTFVQLVGNHTLLAMIFFVLCGLLVGHLMGGPEPDNRTVLSIATASRHPAIAAMLVGTATENKQALAAVLLAFLVGTILCIPYSKWRAKQTAGTITPSSAAGEHR